MKKLMALLAIVATAALAEQVPLNISATGYTELLKPQSIAYVPAIPDVVDDPATEEDETQAAIPAQIKIGATYQLGYKVPVVDTTIADIHTVIAPASMPTFTLDISLPVSTFASFFAGDITQLVQVLELGGTIEPNAELREVIRTVAFSLLGTAEQ